MKEIVFKLGHLRHFDAEKNIKELKKQKKELLKDYKVVAALNDLGKKKVQLDNTVSWIENTLEEINWDWENEGKQLIQFIDDSIGLVTKLKKQEKLNYTLNFYSLKGKIFRKLEDFKNAEIEINNYFELANECFSNEKAATFASKIEVKEKALEVTREVDGGLETISTSLPAVVTADLRLNEPRFATLPAIMKAKKKPLAKLTAEELGVDLTSKLQTIEVSEPPKRQGGTKVNSVEE
ncbi:hypothetical protein HK099_001587, partial [Clydaea vesicula]